MFANRIINFIAYLIISFFFLYLQRKPWKAIETGIVVVNIWGPSISAAYETVGQNKLICMSYARQQLTWLLLDWETD